jgi:hypothetical protein
MQSPTPYQIYKASMWRPALYFYSAFAVALLLYFAWKIIRARERESKPGDYAMSLFLGMAFVLVMSFCGPLVFYLRYSDGFAWLGLLISGFIQWLYLTPAAMIAKRMGKLAFNEGALGAAVILLLLDLVGIVLVSVVARVLSGLR